MSKISLEPNASGAGTFSIVSPDSNTNRTLNLPDESGILFSDGSGVPGSAVAGQLASSNMPAGSVIQVVSAVFTTEVTITSSSFVDSGLSASITPTSGSSKILVLTTEPIFLDNSSANSQALIGGSRLIRNGSPVFSDATTRTREFIFRVGNTSQTLEYGQRNSYCFLDSPNTTNALTYKTQYFIRSGTAAILQTNDREAQSSVILMEIAG